MSEGWKCVWGCVFLGAVTVLAILAGDDMKARFEADAAQRREDGRRAFRAGAGAGGNPYAGNPHEMAAAKAWLDGWLTEAEAAKGAK